jgi:hypothetical protein
LRSHLRQEDERPGKAAFVFMEMVLGDPGRIEAEAFGMDDLLGGQPVALGSVRHIEHASEEAQALWELCCRHGRLPVTRRPSRPSRHRPTGRSLCIVGTVSGICRITARVKR